MRSIPRRYLVVLVVAVVAALLGDMIGEYFAVTRGA